MRRSGVQDGDARTSCLLFCSPAVYKSTVSGTGKLVFVFHIVEMLENKQYPTPILGNLQKAVEVWKENKKRQGRRHWKALQRAVLDLSALPTHSEVIPRSLLRCFCLTQICSLGYPDSLGY